jgi:hypothetical protein
MIDELLDHCKDAETENSVKCAVVACLAALAHGQAGVSDEIVRKGSVRVLAKFVCNQDCPQFLLERSLLALRKLSCSPNSHLQLATFSSDCLSRLLTLCQFPIDIKPSLACEEFEKMTAGCQLVGSVFVDDTSPDPLYVIDLFDTSGEEDVVISDVLVKSGYFRRRDGEKNLCGDEEGRFWVSSIVRSQLDGDMKFMAQLYKIENVGDDKVLIPVNQGKNVVCCLCGLQFVTKELLIVEHTLGILQNITTTSASIRQSIVKLDGVNILLKLIKEHNKHPDCAATAVSVITNLALDISMRQKIGHHALQPLCGINYLKLNIGCYVLGCLHLMGLFLCCRNVER